MPRILITGSSDGLGRIAARQLIADGHRVVLHARNTERAREAEAGAPGAEAVVVGDFTSLAQTRALADEVNRLGAFEAVIHNAAIGYKEKQRKVTEDGLPAVFQANTLAPYVLTALVAKPKRLIYLSSELHRRVRWEPDDLLWERRPWNGNKAYSETKLHDTMLAFAVARRWPGVLANSVEPGWMATKMGGPRASHDLQAGARTQAWLAASNDAEAQTTGGHWYHMARRAANPAAGEADAQERLLAVCAKLSGVALP